ncbi:hypothetical protein WJX74_001564 [Apatococcus lobatus]|uniref:Germin-like protein n=1 Tax=Apatococcus lobatus TaxID=904363 RepID=A0AAW1SEW7_9CHLO
MILKSFLFQGSSCVIEATSVSCDLPALGILADSPAEHTMTLTHCFLAAAVLLASASAQGLAPSTSPTYLTTPTFMTELQQRLQFQGTSLAFTFPTASTNTAAGTIRSMDLSSNPILGTLPNGGISQNVDFFAPCTINVPHVHPRGSEIYYVISGTVEVGIQEEASTGRFISVNATAGQNVVAPQGLMHYVQNNECTGVSLLQIWNNADPGTVVLYANMVNNFPDRALAAFTGLDATAIATLKTSVPKPTAPITQSQSCLARCAAAAGAPATIASAAAAPSASG